MLFRSLEFKKKLLICLVSLLNISHAQEWSSLRDSIDTYKGFDHQKALTFGFQALESSSYNEISLELFEINLKLGELFFLAKMLQNTFRYTSRALAIYDLLPPNERRHKLTKNPPWVLLLLGNVYLRSGRLKKAEKIFGQASINFNLFEKHEQSEKYFGLNASDDSLGTLELEKNNYSQAEFYYKRALDRRLKSFKKSDILFSYLNLLKLYFKKQDKDKTIKYFKLSEELYQNYSFNEKSEAPVFYSEILKTYASYLKNIGKLQEALEVFYEARDLITNYSDLYKQELNFSIAACLIEMKKYETAEKIILDTLNFQNQNVNSKIQNYQLLLKIYNVQKKNTFMLSVNDSLRHYLSKKNFVNNIEFSDLEIQLTIAQKQRELNDNREQYYKSYYIFIVFLSVSVIIIILFIYYFHLQKEKNSRLEIEKKQILTVLDSKKRELVSKVNFIMQRNEYLKNLASKVEKISTSMIKNDIESIVNSDKSYEEFDKIFTQVYPEFYENMKAKHNLSQTYLRLVAYIKMNQNNNEIAKMSGISLRTVETQRYRLSKILNLNEDQDLNTYIINF